MGVVICLGEGRECVGVIVLEVGRECAGVVDARLVRCRIFLVHQVNESPFLSAWMYTFPSTGSGNGDSMQGVIYFFSFDQQLFFPESFHEKLVSILISSLSFSSAVAQEKRPSCGCPISNARQRCLFRACFR